MILSDTDKSKEQLVEELVGLRQRHELWSRVIHTSPDTIALTKASDGGILEDNDCFLKNRVYSRAEAIGKTSEELDIWLSPEDRDRFVGLLKEHGECVNFAASFKSKNGHIINGLISARMEEVDGELCIFSNIRGVTELAAAEQRLRESEGRFRSVVASINEGLLITYIDDVILDLNDRMTDLAGFSAEELKGNPAYELLVMADQWPNMLARNQQRVYGEAETYEIKLRRKDRSWLWAEVSASPYRDTTGEVVGTLGIVSDITERKRLEWNCCGLKE